MKVKLEELVKVKTGKLDANAANEGGQYPFFTCSKEPLSINTYSYDCECVLVAGNGDLNVKYYNGKFDAYQRTYILETITDKLYVPFLYYFMHKYVETLRQQSIGGVIKYIKLENITNAIINLPNFNEQVDICKRIDKVKGILDKYNTEIILLDTLIKARFVEMFGDIESNEKNFKIVNFEDCIEYIGDIGSNGANKVVVDHLDMKDEEDYALLVRFLNFTNNDFKNNVKYISKEAYNFFKKSQIFGGELIFCKIGSAGLNYIMPYLNRPVSLGLNQIMIRIKGNINILYLHNYLNLPYGKKLVENCINGAVTKSITKTEIKKIPILLPPIDLQNQFATFVKEVDKLKFDVQKSLEKTQMLFDGLMQKYFG